MYYYYSKWVHTNYFLTFSLLLKAIPSLLSWSFKDTRWQSNLIWLHPHRKDILHPSQAPTRSHHAWGHLLGIESREDVGSRTESQKLLVGLYCIKDDSICVLLPLWGLIDKRYISYTHLSWKVGKHHTVKEEDAWAVPGRTPDCLHHVTADWMATKFANSKSQAAAPFLISHTRWPMAHQWDIFIPSDILMRQEGGEMKLF